MSNNNRKFKVTQSRSIVEKEALINAVRENSALWKKDEKSYHDKHVFKASWESVSTSTKIPENECKTLWKNLKDSFSVRKKALSEGHSGDVLSDVAGATKARKWVFWDQLQFLHDQTKNRGTSSNYELDSHDLEREATGNKTDNEGSVERDLIFLESKDSFSSFSGYVTPQPSPSQPDSANLLKAGKFRSNKKKSTKDDILGKLGTHMDTINKTLLIPNTPENPFLNYLGEIISGVPTAKKRKCEQVILQIAHAYIDGTEENLVIQVINS